jgi:hypothetical protein
VHDSDDDDDNDNNNNNNNNNTTSGTNNDKEGYPVERKMRRKLSTSQSKDLLLC